jgi:hypothetical protein
MQPAVHPVVPHPVAEALELHRAVVGFRILKTYTITPTLQVALVGRLQETGLGGADVAGLLALRAEAAAAAEVR